MRMCIIRAWKTGYPAPSRISDRDRLCQLLSFNSTKMSFPFHIAEHVIDGQYIREYPRATATPNASLKLCIKQYVPVDNPDPQQGDLTIVATHGTGFPKVSSPCFWPEWHQIVNCAVQELYEPLWEELLARSKQDGVRIRSIWIADAANQGASGVINENNLGNDRR